jgi:hypothetical protein
VTAKSSQYEIHSKVDLEPSVVHPGSCIIYNPTKRLAFDDEDSIAHRNSGVSSIASTSLIEKIFGKFICPATILGQPRLAFQGQQYAIPLNEHHKVASVLMRDFSFKDYS